MKERTTRHTYVLSCATQNESNVVWPGRYLHWISNRFGNQK